ncbi:hypothetical protein ZHAS_00015728 [Anopheles sinensis]|uniref:Uncharacterized protein n=1 Tax=Anopheles sinensis TaxID=74873 RepID=A0A084WBT8_ANOSI|nr:hypothetical protein ZHAS_00015728 [Anopheles sinensis]
MTTTTGLLNRQIHHNNVSSQRGVTASSLPFMLFHLPVAFSIIFLPPAPHRSQASVRLPALTSGHLIGKGNAIGSVEANRKSRTLQWKAFSGSPTIMPRREERWTFGLGSPR